MSSVSAVNSLLSSTTPATPTVNISSILASAVGATTPGIDVTGAVNAALYADRAPERGWQAQQAALASQTTALTAIQTDPHTGHLHLSILDAGRDDASPWDLSSVPDAAVA